MKKGFTLVEIIVVIAILSIIALLAAPEVTKLLSSSNKQVCSDKRKTLTSEYLAMRPYTDNAQNKVLQDAEKPICPNGGVISFDSDLSKFICNLHGND